MLFRFLLKNFKRKHNLLSILYSTVYYKNKPKQSVLDIDNEVCEMFHNRRKKYDTRKIKAKPAKVGIIASIRKFGMPIKGLGLVSFLNTQKGISRVIKKLKY